MNLSGSSSMSMCDLHPNILPYNREGTIGQDPLQIEWSQSLNASAISQCVSSHYMCIKAVPMKVAI